MAARPQLVDRFGIPFDGAAPNLDLFGGGGCLILPALGVDLVSGRVGTKTATATPGISPYGPSIALSGTTSAITGFGEPGFSLRSCTLFAAVNVNAWAARFAISAFNGSSVGTSAGLTFGDTSGTLSVHAGSFGGATAGIKNTTTLTTGRWYAYAGTVVNSVVTSLFIDGQKVATAAVGNFIPPVNASIEIGHRDGSANYMNGGVAVAAIIPRVLSDSDICEILGNLGLLFEPERIWIPVSAGGGTTYNESVSETLATAAESSSSVLEALGALSETAALSDFMAGLADMIGNISETGYPADSEDGSTSGSSVSDSVSESVSVSDSVSSTVDVSSAVSESGSLSDSAASQLEAVAARDETAGLTDSASSALVAVGAVDETAAPADGQSVNPTTYAGSVSESVTVWDTQDATGGSPAGSTTIAKVQGVIHPGNLMNR